jgi:hypothetical protein
VVVSQLLSTIILTLFPARFTTSPALPAAFLNSFAWNIFHPDRIYLMGKRACRVIAGWNGVGRTEPQALKQLDREVREHT